MRSVEASRVIWQTKEKLSGSELLVLHALANHADEHFECYPSLGRLATMTKLSKRQVIRILHGLREKGHLAFEENRGGRQKCNHYRLLIVANGDTKSDTNCDSANGDTSKNGDISNSERATSCAETVTNSRTNGDTAMSPEGFEWLEGVKSESGQKLPPTILRNYDEACEELESNPGKLMTAILAAGIPVTRNEVCEGRGHGSFLRHGWVWGNWLAWTGEVQIYSGSFSEDAGCSDCAANWAELTANHPEWKDNLPIRRFEVRSAVICADHGNFIFGASLCEYGEGYAKLIGNRYSVSAEMCPGCESDWVDGSELCETFGLSNEDWARAGEALLAALHYACGRIDSPQFLSALQNRIIPDLRRK
jgi:hypothetical protein